MSKIYDVEPVEECYTIPFVKKLISNKKLKRFAIACFLYGKNDYPDMKFKRMIEREIKHKFDRGGSEW